eukprot:3257954-Amphidinium_carterae.1
MLGKLQSSTIDLAYVATSNFLQTTCELVARGCNSALNISNCQYTAHLRYFKDLVTIWVVIYVCPAPNSWSTCVPIFLASSSTSRMLAKNLQDKYSNVKKLCWHGQDDNG